MKKKEQIETYEIDGKLILRITYKTAISLKKKKTAWEDKMNDY